ncbi:MAG: methylated-DNA--[protein]-cysteine S-methyltransferase [Clostridia bacterium]|nr:methylated-DNA--[protein]-cysteine S-methyltransferase [Clostridia bacterium]
MYMCIYNSAIGDLLLVSDGTSLTHLLMNREKYIKEDIEQFEEKANLPIFEKTKQWLDCYFSGQEPTFHVTINPEGTEFRKEVWKLLLDIPFGQVVTYKEIAQKIALKQGIKIMSSRAVGSAIGHNPISIIIPCHRVIGSNGTLTGYAGGLENKRKLLENEGIVIKN